MERFQQLWTTALPSMTGIRCFSSFYLWIIKLLYLFLRLLFQVLPRNHNCNSLNVRERSEYSMTVLSTGSARELEGKKLQILWLIPSSKLSNILIWLRPEFKKSNSYDKYELWKVNNASGSNTWIKFKSIWSFKILIYFPGKWGDKEPAKWNKKSWGWNNGWRFYP